MGDEDEVEQHEAVALYESERLLGDTNKRTNADNVNYMKSIGKEVFTGERWLVLKDRKPKIVDLEGNEYAI